MRLPSAGTIASVVFVAGVALLAVGVALIYVPAGLIVAGGSAAAGAFFHERGRPK